MTSDDTGNGGELTRSGGRGLSPLGSDLKPPVRAFAEYLRELYDRSGLNQTRLAAELFTNAPQLSRYLRGKHLPSLAWLRNFQRWLKENAADGFDDAERNIGRELLFDAALIKDIKIAHDIERDRVIEVVDARLAARIDTLEQQVKKARTKANEERARQRRDREATADDRKKIDDLEKRVAELEQLKTLIQGDRADLAATTAGVTTELAVREPEDDTRSFADFARVFQGAREYTGERPARIWGAIPPKNPDFIGRADLMARLARQLDTPGGTSVPPVALVGTGGVGKSQIVAEYLNGHEAELDLGWWVQAEHPTQIRSSFVDLARKLGIQVGSAEYAVPAVLEALRRGEPFNRWLVVFDNVDKADDIRDFLPSGTGRVIITSRNPEWKGVAHTIEVDLLAREESIGLLRRHVADLEVAAADRLAAALGDLPLALKEAAAWLTTTGMSVQEYVRLLDQYSSELLRAGQTSFQEIPVAAVWNVPLHRLRSEHRGALELLQLCAFLAPEPIPRDLFSGFRSTSPLDHLADTLADPVRLNRDLREISRSGLAKIDRRNGTLRVHRLLRLVLRDQLDSQVHSDVRHAAHLLLVNGDPDDPDTPAQWPRYAALLPHAIASRATDCQDRWVRVLITNLVRYVMSAADVPAAVELSRQALSAWRDSAGETDRDTLTMSRLHGEALRDDGQVTAAGELNQRTLEIVAAQLGPDNEATVAMSDSVGFDLRAQGLFMAERDQVATAVDDARRILGPEIPETSRYAHHLAECHRLTGEYAKARALDEDTLHQRELVLGTNHPQTLMTRTALAMDIRECGDYATACQLQRENNDRISELVAPDHPLAISGDRCLAVASRRTGQYEAAMELTQHVNDRCGRRYREEHIATATAAMDLAIEHRNLGDLPHARDLGTRAAGLFERIYGPAHPFPLVALTNLAVTCRLLGEPAEARQRNQRAASGLRAALGSDHPYTRVATANLASDLAALGDADQARRIDTENLDHLTLTLGARHPTTLAVAHNLSLDLQLLGRSDAAEKHRTAALAGCQAVLGDAHPTTRATAARTRVDLDADTMHL